MIDVARRAGVSRAAVGVVLHGTGGDRIRVARDTADRIKQIAAEMNYKPNLAARQLAGKKSKIIGLMMDPLPNEANSIRLATIEARCREKGYHLMTLHEQPKPTLVKDCLDQFVGRSIDGLICLHHYYPGKPHLVAELVTSRIDNVVFFDPPGAGSAPYAGPDHIECSRLAVRYLLKRGYQNLGFLIADLHWYSGPRYRQGFIEEMIDHGQQVNDDLIWVGRQDAFADLTQLSVESADRIIDDLVVKQQVDAIVCAEDYWAARVLNRLQDRGFRVPQDVAIVGLGNKKIADYVRPSLTTVDPRLAEAAGRVVDMIIAKIEGADIADQSILIKPTLVERESA